MRVQLTCWKLGLLNTLIPNCCPCVASILPGRISLMDTRVAGCRESRLLICLLSNRQGSSIKCFIQLFESVRSRWSPAAQPEIFFRGVLYPARKNCKKDSLHTNNILFSFSYLIIIFTFQFIYKVCQKHGREKGRKKGGGCEFRGLLCHRNPPHTPFATPLVTLMVFGLAGVSSREVPVHALTADGSIWVRASEALAAGFEALGAHAFFYRKKGCSATNNTTNYGALVPGNVKGTVTDCRPNRPQAWALTCVSYMLANIPASINRVNTTRIPPLTELNRARL